MASGQQPLRSLINEGVSRPKQAVGLFAIRARESDYDISTRDGNMRDMPNQINESPDSSIRRAILRAQGYYLGPLLPSIETCAQLTHDIYRCFELSNGVPAQGSIRVVSVLQDSDSSLGLVDDAKLGALVDEVIGADAIFSRLAARG